MRHLSAILYGTTVEMRYNSWAARSGADVNLHVPHMSLTCTEQCSTCFKVYRNTIPCPRTTGYGTVVVSRLVFDVSVNHTQFGVYDVLAVSAARQGPALRLPSFLLGRQAQYATAQLPSPFISSTQKEHISFLQHTQFVNSPGSSHTVHTYHTLLTGLGLKTRYSN